jgi:hypothetical protein
MKDFIDGWKILEWGVVGNCFDSMFTKCVFMNENEIVMEKRGEEEIF